jgi:hypothetical protein
MDMERYCVDAAWVVFIFCVARTLRGIDVGGKVICVWLDVRGAGNMVVHGVVLYMRLIFQPSDLGGYPLRIDF